MFHLFLCRPVDLAHLADRCPEVTGELPVMLRDLAQCCRAAAEEFLSGIQLLVDLDTGNEAECLIIHEGSSASIRL